MQTAKVINNQNGKSIVFNPMSMATATIIKI